MGGTQVTTPTTHWMQMLHGLSEQSSHGTDEEACVGYKHQV